MSSSLACARTRESARQWLDAKLGKCSPAVLGQVAWTHDGLVDIFVAGAEWAEQQLQQVPGEDSVAAHGERFPNRAGYGEPPNVRPVTSGPLADPSVAELLVTALAGDAPALGMDGPVFRLQTADPRFDPAEPLLVNGHRFTPATED